MRNGNAGLTIGAVLLAVLASALAWLFFISPRMSAMSEARSAAVDAQDQNDLLELQLLTLQKDAERLPELREQVYSARDDLPPVMDVPALRANLRQVFAANGLVILQETVGDSVQLDPLLSLTDAAAAVGLSSPTDGLDFTGLVGTPIDIRTVGTLSRIEGLLNDLQRGEHQYLLVAQINFTPIDTAGQVNGVAVAPGDVEAAISMMAFNLGVGDTAVSVRPEGIPYPGDSWDFPYNQEPSNNRNFFQPLPGR